MSDRTELHWIITSLLVIFLAVGCGGDGGDAGSSGKDSSSGAASVENPVDASTAGNISGTVTFEGDAPTMETIDMAAEEVCAAKHSSAPTSKNVLVNDNGTLANVFVYVKSGLEDLSFPTPEPTLLDQDGCTYIPHVLGVMTDQDINIRNSDGILHNINATPDEQRGFNTSQPVNMETSRSFGVSEVMIPVRCDVHGWMGAYIGVLSHPYHSVSSSEGSFDLATLPPGDYVIEAWHEYYGTQTQNVTVATGETAEITFTFSASMAGAVIPLGEAIDLHKHATDTD